MDNDIKFQTDEHIPSAVIKGLRRRGIDVLSTPEADLRGAADEEQLAFAAQKRRVFVTQDDDFLIIHSQGMEHAGIVFVQPGKSIGYMVRGLHFIFQMMTTDAMQNHVEFL
jgi:predicted nuclease of predicted toxin-antitoxin system